MLGGISHIIPCGENRLTFTDAGQAVRVGAVCSGSLNQDGNNRDYMGSEYIASDIAVQRQALLLSSR